MKIINNIFKKLFNREIEEKLKEIESTAATYKQVYEMMASNNSSYYISTHTWAVRDKEVFVKLLDMGWKATEIDFPGNGIYQCKIVRL